MKDLINAGANVDVRDFHHHYTALDVACQEGQLDCVRSLLEAHANMHSPDRNKFIPINAAAQFNRPGVVQTLIDYGCDKNVVSTN